MSAITHPCLNHPDRESIAYCQRFGRYYCDECLACHDPENYCKFRTACLVWEFQKHGVPEDEPAEADQQASEK